ncbi:GNAT family N-acetyltransferase [Sulfurimonas sp. SAG-AH-194-C20]|nr:GNAT family N-acetyltransferase [Sulfurimonas sp. SAG-AH-194-C20]MDF1878090.1 GNAT family N-acetyltransferase [Sulfurimonas sp. SAG-AH-194-C20]
MQAKKLIESDLELFYKYAKIEKWDIEDIHIRSLLKTHPDNFFIFYKDNVLVGYVVALNESAAFGFISSLLVLKEFRGLGYGAEIFSLALKHLQNRQIALDSVLGQETFYEKFGFSSYFDVNLYLYKTGKVSLKESDTLEVVAFDEKHSLEGKSDYLKYLLQDKDIYYKAIKGVSDSFAFIFPYKDGHKITINSQDINHAVTLLFALCQNYESNTAIYLQSSQQNTMLEALAQALGMSKVSHHTRMYNKILAGDEL